MDWLLLRTALRNAHGNCAGVFLNELRRETAQLLAALHAARGIPFEFMANSLWLCRGH
jgi:hypothetical protein